MDSIQHWPQRPLLLAFAAPAILAVLADSVSAFSSKAVTLPADVIHPYVLSVFILYATAVVSQQLAMSPLTIQTCMPPCPQLQDYQMLNKH